MNCVPWPRFRVASVTVNVVSLGPIQTGWIGPELEVAAATNTPLGRVGQPEEIAALCAFLVSEEAGWITGGIHSIDGGRALLSAR